MSKVVITTDSGCNPINKDNMIPGIIIGKTENYYDTIKISNDDMTVLDGKEVLERVINGEKLTTSGPNYNDYLYVFTKYLSQGYDIVHLCTSSLISAGSNNMPYAVINEIAEEYDNKVYLIDTMNVGSGGTIINLLAENLKNSRLSAHDIKEVLERIKLRILSSYYISSLTGYRTSGRVPQGTKLLDIMSLRYRVDVNDKGELVPKKFFRGKVGVNALKYVKDLINENNIENFDSEYLTFLSTILNQIDKEEILDYIKSFNYFKNVIEENFYGIISAYGVIDQIGIGLVKKK